MQNSVQSSLLRNYIIQNPQNQTPARVVSTPVNLQKEEPPKESKKQKIAKIALASAVLAAGTGAVIASTRHQGGPVKAIKATGHKLKEIFTSDTTREAAGTARKKAAGLGEYQNGANNITNVKDTFMRRLLSHIPGYSKFDEFTANIYRKACKNSVNKGYQKAIKANQSALDSVSEALKNGDLDEASANKLTELLKKKLNGITDFAKGADTRFNNVDKSLGELDKDAWETVKGLKGKGFFGRIREYTRKSVVDGRLTGAKALQNEAITSDMQSALSGDDVKALDELLSGIKNEKVAGKIKNANKAFERARIKESRDMFDKLRDINCGSAATDIMTAAGTAGLLGIYTAQADSKEEKVGVTLTTGIPLGVTLATTIGATVNMISGGKALALGALTGFLANRLGSAANKKYQKSKGIETPQNTIISAENKPKLKLNIGA